MLSLSKKSEDAILSPSLSLCVRQCEDLPSFGIAAGYISFSRSPSVCTLPSGETGRNSFWMNGLSLIVCNELEHGELTSTATQIYKHSATSM